MMKQLLVYTALPLLALVSTAGPARAMEGRAWGDIHVQTLDGATYDFQAAGEFVASRSTAGDLEVQLRLESTGFSNYVSIVTAVAVLVDTSRASVALRREPMLSVEGQPVTLSPEVDQKVRDLTFHKNRQYFYNWRPQNITYLLGFRKHEQGQNAKELPQFIPLIEKNEAEIHRLVSPQ